MSKPHRGRFAPSPTGELHLGSMLAAVASYCQARSKNGEWILRIEDVDQTRVVPGAATSITNTLTRFGMISDHPVSHQSDPERQHAYQKALDRLALKNLTYPCQCTRKMLRGLKKYPGTCRNNPPPSSENCSVRVKTKDQATYFKDQIQGPQTQAPQGDFIIKRKDGLFAYQLAVVLDDHDQGITEVVRGIDILDATSHQIRLIEMLQLDPPDYAHIPIVVNAQNQKLSKQNHAKSIANEDPYRVLWHSLALLQQQPPTTSLGTVNQLLDWAIIHWSLTPLQGLKSVVAEAGVGC